MEYIWFQKYRPSTAGEYKFKNKQTQEVVQRWIEQKNFPHILLSGIQGTGKSSLANVLINDCGINRDSDVLSINLANHGIDAVRDKVIPFVKTLPRNSPFRVVILEEFEKLQKETQKSLNVILEDSSEFVRFIGTTNNVNKVIPALNSRFQTIEFEQHDRDEIIDFCVDILEKEGVEIESEEAFFEHIDTYLPDVRKIIGSMQLSSTNNNNILTKVLRSGDSNDGLETWKDLWASGFSLNDSFDVAMSLIDDNVFEYNFEEWYEAMYKNFKHSDLDDSVIVIIANWLNKSYTMAFKDLALQACLVEIKASME